MRSSVGMSILVLAATQIGTTFANKLSFEGGGGVVGEELAVRQLSTSADGTCSNGVPGIENAGQCCVLECGQCGGTGCSVAATAAGLDAADCCTIRIRNAGVFCDDTGTAPCTIEGTSGGDTCSNGLPGIETVGMCCVAECPVCGGIGCADEAEAVGLAASDCCTGRIRNSGVFCDISGEAPCIVDGPGTGGDPHMIGLRGQKIDWNGEDGGWYALMKDGNDAQMSVKLTAPLPEDFPDRQLITGFALEYDGGHSIVVENKTPYTTETHPCSPAARCLSEDALRITIDGIEYPAVSTVNSALPGGAAFSAFNLPAKCQPYGGDRIWADEFAQWAEGRRRLRADQSITEWVSRFSATTAAPGWCERFLAETSELDLLSYSNKHSVFHIMTPSFEVRLHHGTNHQGGEVVEDGRILPDLEFWQMDVHLEGYYVNPDTVTGILGETLRPVLGADGEPIMFGPDALRGEPEDYRVPAPRGA